MVSRDTVHDRFRPLAGEARAWPFEEARKIVGRLDQTPKSEVIFETGYGPSGLPHIGTFGEVARTTMVRNAFETLSDVPTRLICFSDDMDGFRKVPDNVPNQELLAAHLKKPLTQVPDPFGTHESFGHHNNAMLRSFLDRFGFAYDFMSATDCYRSGLFDQTLIRVLEEYDRIIEVILPTLGPDRRATYAPVLPNCPRTGVVLEVPLEEVRPASGTVIYRDPETEALIETPVTGGHAKLQWKADWAMRWVALGIDYEMSGKDLIDSVKLSSRIATILGAKPPEGFNYELFLDENGEKISKSKGNGLTIDEWLSYASPESLSLFMYQKPRAAKRLHFDVIPRQVDDYFSFLSAYGREEDPKRLENPVWHIHSAQPPEDLPPVSFSMLLNLVSASNAEDAEVLWGFIGRYAPGASPKTDPKLDELVGYAVRYFHDFVRATKVFRPPTDQERAALADLSERLLTLPDDADGETIQNQVYAVGKEHAFEPLRAWFSAIYEVLLGQSQGPRFGSFIALYGITETRELIAKGLSGALVAEAEAPRASCV
ncbi:MAG: lysine--tRNA ligase [Pseudomonadota bacterium]